MVILANRANSAWFGLLRPYQGFNSKWAGRWAVDGKDFTGQDYAPITVDKRSTKKFRVTGDGTTRSGYLDIGPYSSDIDLYYFYEFRTADGVLMDTVGSSFSLSSTTFGFTVERSPVTSTCLAWCPVLRSSTSGFNIVLTLYDSNGAVARQKTVRFNGHQAQFFDQIFTDLPSSFLGYLSVQSDFAVYLAVLRFELTPTGFQYTYTQPSIQRF